MNEQTIRRFITKFLVGDECWEWTASKDRGGYGTFKLDGKTAIAHRVSYRLFVGEIPKGLELDHLCRVRHCVNPKHLEPVTKAENTRRGIAGDQFRNRTHCVKGHPFSGDNLFVRKNGHRECRTCMRDRARAYRAKRQ